MNKSNNVRAKLSSVKYGADSFSFSNASIFAEINASVKSLMIPC